MTENQKVAEKTLNAVRSANDKIRKMREAIEAKRLAALPGAITYDKERVQTSPANFTETLLVDAADLEAELKEYMESVDRLKLAIYQQITQLSVLDHQSVLLFYFFDELQWSEVAQRMAVSESRIYEIRSDALESFGILLSVQNLE